MDSAMAVVIEGEVEPLLVRAGEGEEGRTHHRRLGVQIAGEGDQNPLAEVGRAFLSQWSESQLHAGNQTWRRNTRVTASGRWARRLERR